MIAIVDYGVGNLFSLESSFAAIGEPVTVTGDAKALREAERIVLPGVGAFGDAVYFVHSYFADNCAPCVLADAEYGAELTAAVQKENVFGCQFHPEKSGKVVLNILKAFCEVDT